MEVAEHSQGNPSPIPPPPDEVAAAAVAMSSPSLPWTSLLTVKIINTITALSSRQNGTVNRRLLDLFAYTYKAKPNPKPINGVSSLDVTVDPSRKLWFRLFLPAAAESSSPPLPVIVFFHGGGFAYLSADNKAYDAVARRFARQLRAVVVSVNYRLSPEHRYPAQYDDGFDVLKFLDGGGKDVLPENADVSRCFVAGDSAGANVAHHVAKRACNSDDFKQLRVVGLVSIQPFFGGNERTEAEIKLAKVDPLISVARTDWLWKAFLPSGEGADRDHEAINVSGPRAIDLSNLKFPATMVVIGGFDSLKDWQMRYYQWLKKCGKEVYLVEYPNMVHAFYIFPQLKESGDLIAKVMNFVDNQCSKEVK
ncbi:OLC1v1036613C1 [Oldenlandia corymbosa var. corymbosa]|uniref:OLC1v1036613C1 n=1 Tax=Oldenlandia corymbosa var. corymbosa TaxID=529605 RepID=A0AAV1CVS7_OLDCO|nr:OLC1v1036613C1 [Oldenlandia corymbosa var. corymbosa]